MSTNPNPDSPSRSAPVRSRALLLTPAAGEAELRAAIEPAGWALEEVPDHLSALALALRSPPDVVLADPQTAKAADFCNALRADPRTRHVAFFWLTDFADPGTLMDCLSSGAHGFIGVPYQPLHVVDLLAQVRPDRLAGATAGPEAEARDEDRADSEAFRTHLFGLYIALDPELGRVGQLLLSAIEELMRLKEALLAEKPR